MRSVHIAEPTWEALLRAALGCVQADKSQGAAPPQCQQLVLELAQPADAQLHRQEGGTSRGAANDSSAALNAAKNGGSQPPKELTPPHAQLALAEGAGQLPVASGAGVAQAQAEGGALGSGPRAAEAGAADVGVNIPSEAPAAQQDEQRPPVPKKDVPAPSRASRRLKAQRCASPMPHGLHAGSTICTLATPSVQQIVRGMLAHLEMMSGGYCCPPKSVQTTLECNAGGRTRDKRPRQRSSTSSLYCGHA